MSQAEEWAARLREHCDELAAHEGLVLEPRGHFLRPGLYVLRDREFHSTVANHEWFSPLLVVDRCDDEEQMIARANDSRFALAAAVFTKEKGTFRRVADELESGLVNWNRATVGSSSKLPFGGTKESGNHRPAALYSPLYCADVVAELHVSNPQLAPLAPGLRVRD